MVLPVQKVDRHRQAESKPDAEANTAVVPSKTILEKQTGGRFHARDDEGTQRIHDDACGQCSPRSFPEAVTNLNLWLPSFFLPLTPLRVSLSG